MASSIPRTARRRYAAYLSALSLKVAFFTDTTGYSATAATNTYTTFVAGGATEVAHASYTTGGYALTVADSDLAGNGAKLTATATSVSSATFSVQYAVIYRNAAPGSDHIEAVVDFGSSYPIVNGTITITWDATNGVINIA